VKLDEVSTLLDSIAGMDGRSFPGNAAESWYAVLRHYPLTDALRAVQEHYAVNEGRVMPAHIRTRCIQLRDLRDAQERRALPAPTRPVLTSQGLAARAEVRRLVAQVAGNMDRALREPMRADASEPTSATSEITEAERDRQLRRLRHEGRA
jgi:hypothetical protein